MLHVTVNPTLCPRFTMRIIQIGFVITHAESLVSKEWLSGQIVNEMTITSNSEIVIRESIDLRDILRFLVLH